MDYPKSCGKIAERVARLRELRDMISMGGATVTLTVVTRDGVRKRTSLTLGPAAARAGIGDALKRSIDFEEGRLSTQKPRPRRRRARVAAVAPLPVDEPAAASAELRAAVAVRLGGDDEEAVA